jgi:hypothetical protein
VPWLLACGGDLLGSAGAPARPSVQRRDGRAGRRRAGAARVRLRAAGLRLGGAPDASVGALAGYGYAAALLFCVGAYLLAGLFFVRWLFRAARNLRVYSDARPWWPAAAVIGAWFVPVANLLLPGLLTADLAARSCPATSPERRRMRWLAAGWWLAFSLGQALWAASLLAWPAGVGGVQLQLSRAGGVSAGDALAGLANQVALSLVAAVVTTLAAALGIVLVHRVTGAQLARLATLTATPAVPSYRPEPFDRAEPADGPGPVAGLGGWAGPRVGDPAQIPAQRRPIGAPVPLANATIEP